MWALLYLVQNVKDENSVAQAKNLSTSAGEKLKSQPQGGKEHF